MTKKIISFLFLFLFCGTLFAQKKEEKKVVVKVLSFNILHGATTNGSFDLDIIANVIKKADADFVSLQEVDFKTNRAKKYDLPTELGYRTKMASVFGRAMFYDGGEYGEGVLSKSSFLSTRNIALPYSKENEPRAALEVTTVLKSGDTISFIGTHLDHLKDNTDRVLQAKAINKTFRNNKYPTILSGDLNDTPHSNSINILESFWKASYNKQNPLLTFPSNKPIKKIDYVLFYPRNRWKIVSKETICDTIASDHCAYLVALELVK
ncbi:endonuclease/exonuclease/phosphatase family protein [Polaribacter cellanae]|uniref:Endonuclease/exonuclease/phosphatase family protein n=1 Tax=Polaribacter cellanae TaxID=2818493 RepID=A0A975H759_9FLAO|nr:endonuclease/exonuclease/phosphatase family protein [Polaribacter cellanae]QTE22723.1 endonuclease/exonuclease/phosphatase family protein [Polaribacter cellanae]